MELQKIPGDGVVTGYGLVEGRQVFVFAQDFTVFGGSVSGAYAEKVCKVMDRAMQVGAPSSGSTTRAAPASRRASSRWPATPTSSSEHARLRPRAAGERHPGAVRRGAAYSPAITDFIFMVKDTSSMFVNGPEVLRAVTHEEVTREDLGGALVHARRSGVAHFAFDERGGDPAQRARAPLLPALNNADDPPVQPCSDDPGRREAALKTLVPDDPRKPYDMRDLVRAVADDGHSSRWRAVRPEPGGGFVRLDGGRSEWWRTSRRCWRACSTPTPR